MVNAEQDRTCAWAHGIVPEVDDRGLCPVCAADEDDDEDDDVSTPQSAWPHDDGTTFVAARVIPDDPDHVRCAYPGCGQTYGNTLRDLWTHLEQQHDADCGGPLGTTSLPHHPRTWHAANPGREDTAPRG